MLALLIHNQIPANKSIEKEGVTLSVDQNRFVDAVEVLRQNGLPRRHIVTIQELFPSGQLVSSPEQEEAKLSYLKSQQLEKMLGSIDGVITSEVSVAEPRSLEGEPPLPSSVAVFIKYSPEVNLPVREAEIRALIRNGIPSLDPDRISLTLQRAKYLYQRTTDRQGPFNLFPHYGQAIAVASVTILLGVMMFLTIRWRYLAKRKK